MSPRGSQFKSECNGKVAFSHRDKAERNIRRHRDSKDAPELHAYRCSFGDHWHIGHQPAERLSKTTKRYERPRQRRWEYA